MRLSANLNSDWIEDGDKPIVSLHVMSGGRKLPASWNTKKELPTVSIIRCVSVAAHMKPPSLTLGGYKPGKGLAQQATTATSAIRAEGHR